MHIDDETTLSDRWVPTKPLVIGSASAVALLPLRVFSLHIVV